MNTRWLAGIVAGLLVVVGLRSWQVWDLRTRLDRIENPPQPSSSRNPNFTDPTFRLEQRIDQREADLARDLLNDRLGNR